MHRRRGEYISFSSLLDRSLIKLFKSLCIRAHKEVWKLRVDVRILDDDGALLDCASVAAVAALYHFRRPNVTVQPNHTIIVSSAVILPIHTFQPFSAFRV